MEPLANVTSITLHRTNDTEMGAEAHLQPGTQKLTPAEAVAYLNADPRNAIVITDLDEESGECKPNGHHIAVWRGAAEDLTNFYYQELPLEEPDAEGGDLDAATAISHALDALCS